MICDTLVTQAKKKKLKIKKKNTAKNTKNLKRTHGAYSNQQGYHHECGGTMMSMGGYHEYTRDVQYTRVSIQIQLFSK